MIVISVAILSVLQQSNIMFSSIRKLNLAPIHCRALAPIFDCVDNDVRYMQSLQIKSAVLWNEDDDERLEEVQTKGR